MNSQAERLALKVALIYICVAIAWILFSDELVKKLITDPETRVTVSILKGWIFVLATGGMLYAALKRFLLRWEAERKRAEAALRLSDFSVNQSLLPTFWISRDSRIVRANRAACAGLGYSEGELLQLAITDIDPDFPAEHWPEHWQELREKKNLCFETRHQHKDGHCIPVEVQLNWFEFGGQEFNFAFARDISERKQAQQRLAETAEQLLAAQNIARLGSYVWNVRDGRWTSSAIMDELFGILNSGFTKDLAGWLQIVHPEERAEMGRYLQEEILKSHAHFDRTYRIIRQNDQKERWVHGLGKLVFDNEGQVLQMLGVIQDVTERKQAEEALRRSQERYVQAERAVADGMWDWNILTDEEYFSPRWKEILGFSDTELRGHKSAFLELIHPDDRSVVNVVTRGHLEQGLRYAAEFRLRHKDGGYRWVFSRGEATRDAAGRPVRMFGATTDITERKRAEEAMRESEERFRGLFTATTDAVFQVDWKTSQILEANPAAEKLYGYSREEFLQLQATDISAEPEKTKDAIATTEMRIPLRLHRRKDGTIFPVEISGAYFESQNRQIHVAVMRDITERQRSQAALQDSERLLRTVMDLVPHFIFVKDAKSRHLLVNRACAVANGLTPEQMVGMSDLECVRDRAQAEVFMRDDRAVIESGKPKFIAEERFTNAAGQMRIFQTTKIPFTAPGTGGKALMGIVVDITDLKESEAAHLKMQRLLAAALTSMTDAVFISDTAGNFIEFNDAFATFHRFKSKAECARRLADYPEIIDVITDKGELLPLDQWVVPRALRGDSDSNVEYTLRRKDTGETWIGSYTFSPIRDNDGVITGSVVVGRDITYRRRVEETLRASEEKFRQLAENITDVFWMTTPDSKDVLYVSPAYAKIWGCSTASLYAHPHQWVEAIVPEDRERVFAAFSELGKNGLEVNVEYRITRPDGGIRWIHDRGFQVRDAAGQIVRLAGVASDVTERKLAELALQRSESVLLEGQRLAQLGNWEWNTVTGRHVWSQEIYRIYGRDPELGPADTSEVSKYFTAESWARLNAAVEQGLAEGSPYECDAEMVRADGARGWITARGEVLRDADGKITGLHGTVQDITARKQAEAALFESEERLRFVTENVRVGMVMVNQDRRYAYANSAYVRILDLPTENIIGKRVADVLPKLYDEQIRPRLDRAFAGERVAYELKRTTRDGDHFFAVTYEPVNLDGPMPLVLVVITDITERKQADAEMNLQFSALSAAANAIMITDQKGRIKWINPAFTRLTGYGVDEVKGRNPRFQKSGQHPPAFYATLWATVNTGNVWHGELINKRKDGRLYNEDMTITPVRGVDGQIAHFVAIKQDVTERRTLENQLRQAQKMEAIGTLAGGIAHDFNNMLAAMFGFGYLLQQDTEGNAAAQESIGEILKAANRAKELVQQILTFSRQREQKREVIRLDTVVKEATKFLRASLPAQIKIEVQIAADAPAVLADATQIYQVTMNLATNALHAMDGRPGTLTVKLETFEPDQLFREAHPERQENNFTRLTVADSGHGMDAQTLERIFEPFFTTKPVGKGTGLGLAVVHGIVLSHDGVITVESEVGRGTTFSLYFPAQAGRTALPEAKAGGTANGRGQNILLLDDEPSLTAAFRRLLERLNYHVTVCNRARDAVSKFCESPLAFDLVITDLTMPEMNGVEVAQQIRACRADVPIVLVSGHSPELTPEKLQAAGIYALLEKPVGITALADVMQRALTNI